MMGVCLVLAAFGVGPHLNPIDGTRIVASDRELFASGRDVSSVADTWLVQVVNQQVGGGGITRFDPMRLAFHGNSWTQTRFLLNGLEMTDPGRSGSPLVELPFGAWDALEFRYQTQAKPGFNFIYEPDRDVPVFSGEVRLGRPVGGGTWVPVGLMDREPATYHGATTTRRALRDAREVDLHHQFRGESWVGRVGAEYFGHSHTYPGFVDEKSTPLRDEAGRVALIGGASLKGGPVPVDVVFAAAEHRRSHEGAEFRLPWEYTRNVLSRAFVLQGTAKMGRLEVKAGGGWAKDTERPNAEVPLVKDLEEEWMWLERPRLAEDLSRWRWDLDLRWVPESKPAGEIEWDFRVRAGLVGLLVTPRWGSDLVGVTHNLASSLEGRSVWMTHYETRSDQTLRWGDLRPELRVSGAFGAVRWKGDLGWSLTELNHSGGEVFSRNGFIAGLSGRRKMGDFEVFAAARREPEEMTSEVARFIDSDSPSGSRHVWDDKDGDGIPGLTEQVEVLGRTGGAYHEVDPVLSTPTRSFVSAGVKTPRFGSFVFVLMTHFRWLQDRYTVRYGPKGEPIYVTREIRDPGGDRQDLSVHDRLRGTEGEEWFRLTNATRSDFYFGTELQLRTEGVSGWFLNLSASGYLSQGSGAFGTFPDRNDAGILHEVSADPNARINQRSRYDHDRAFGVNLLAGWDILERLRWTLAGRYRDGEPMTRYFVTSLSQGPVVIMAHERGAPIPRHTFHMTLDTRLALAFEALSMRGVLSLDCLNLLGSGTELLEDIRTTSAWRRSLEMVPGRAVLINLALRAQ